MPNSRRFWGSSRGSGRISKKDGDSEEEDARGLVKEKDGSSSKNRKPKDYPSSASSSSRSSSSRRHPHTALIMISEAKNTSSNSEPEIARRPSAPVAIPGRSKSHGKNSKYHSHGDEEEDDDGEMLPPHEMIAKRLAKSHISSSSVLEGAGRTLKGRDLSNVRDAVLKKTGFIE